MTHAYLGLAALDLTATTVGYAFLRCTRIAESGFSSLRYAGLGFLAGWALLGVSLSFAVMAGLDPRLPQVLLVGLALIAICAVARRRFPPLPRVDLPPERSLRARSAALSGGALVVLTLVSALLEAVKAPADMAWDAWQFWLPKAEAIYYYHGLDTGLSGFTTYGNAEYPPLAPTMDAATFHFMGGIYPELLPLQQCLLLVAFVASVAALLRRVPRWILYPSLAMLVLAPQVWGEMFSVLPDQTLSYLLAIVAVAGILWLEDPRRAWVVLAVVFLAAAALTKTEGLLLGFLLAAVVTCAGLAMHRRAALGAFALLLGPLAIVPWKLWLATHRQPLSAGVYSWTSLLHPGYMSDRFGRLTYAGRYMLDLLADPDRWTPILPLTFAALIVLAPTLRALSAALGVWLLVAFFGLAAVYWIGTPDVVWYATSSASRVVTNLVIVAGAALPLVLGIALERDRAGANAKGAGP
jgi:hypothetical protein